MHAALVAAALAPSLYAAADVALPDDPGDRAYVLAAFKRKGVAVAAAAKSHTAAVAALAAARRTPTHKDGFLIPGAAAARAEAVKAAQPQVEAASARLDEAYAAPLRHRRVPHTLPANLVGVPSVDGDVPVQYTVTQVLGPDACLISIAGTAVWFERDTTGLTDGAKIQFTRPVEVTGTKAYTTVLGASKTVKAIRLAKVPDLSPYNRPPARPDGPKTKQTTTAKP